jgi:hypothetical protein
MAENNLSRIQVENTGSRIRNTKANYAKRCETKRSETKRNGAEIVFNYLAHLK